MRGARRPLMMSPLPQAKPPVGEDPRQDLVEHPLPIELDEVADSLVRTTSNDLAWLRLISAAVG